MPPSTLFPLPMTRLRGLEPLLVGDLWRRWHVSGRVFALDDVRAQVRYLRLKPEHSCRLTVFAPDNSVDGGPERPPRAFLIYLLPSAERALEVFAKETARPLFVPPDGYAPFVDEAAAAVALPFPNDPEIPALRHIYQPDRLRRTIEELLPEYPSADWRVRRRALRTELLAYKPGRRAVYRIDVKLRRRAAGENATADEVVQFHAKFESPKSVECSSENAHEIYRASRDCVHLRVPRPRPRVAERALTACDWVAGRSLASALKDPTASVLETLHSAGRALAELHALPIDIEHLASPVEERGELLEVAAALAALLPNERVRLERLADALSRQLAQFSVEPSAIVHGDLHPGQWIIAPNDAVVLTDFDRAGRGYALYDLGNMYAHLAAFAPARELFRAFAHGYQELAESALDPELLRAACAVALLRGAVTPFRSLRSEWPRETVRIIEQVSELVERMPSDLALDR
ncbi:MAG: phosphotransferase enzyme family protein [Planctomycetota bacterium]